MRIFPKKLGGESGVKHREVLANFNNCILYYHSLIKKGEHMDSLNLQAGDKMKCLGKLMMQQDQINIDQAMSNGYFLHWSRTFTCRPDIVISNERRGLNFRGHSRLKIEKINSINTKFFYIKI